MSKSIHHKPIRAGIFASVDHAEDAVRKLLDAGFDANEISVVCSEEVKHGHFQSLDPEDEEPESKRSVVAKAGFAGGALGALVSLSGVVTTGGIAIAVAGPILLGGITGTLLGLLVGQGVEDELARFYDQSVGKGDILVAVDIVEDDEQQVERLALASQILNESGTKPFPLEEG